MAPICDYERQDQDFNERMKITQNGEYLRVQYCEHPVHIYKLLGANGDLHPCIERFDHNGNMYGLVAIEDDKT
jgi:hypothetical protein